MNSEHFHFNTYSRINWRTKSTMYIRNFCSVCVCLKHKTLRNGVHEVVCTASLNDRNQNRKQKNVTIFYSKVPYVCKYQVIHHPMLGIRLEGNLIEWCEHKADIIANGMEFISIGLNVIYAN